MTPQERARGVLAATRESAAGEEGQEELEEEARASRSAVRPIRDVPDQYVFRFEVGPAILAMLLEKLELLPRVSLLDALDGAPYPGFYQLFLNGDPKYIGKTARPVAQRLREHVGKLYGRRGIDLDGMQCRYAFVEDPSLVDVAEGALISFFSNRGLAEWNMSGFGSKVSGHGRGGQRASEWALQYPSDTELAVPAGSPGPVTVLQLVQQLMRVSPITLSIPTVYRQRFKEDHPNPTLVPVSELPFSTWVGQLEQLLSATWRIDRKSEAWYIVPRD